MLDGPVPGCADAIELVGQVLMLPAGSLTLDAQAVFDRVALVTTGATYTFSMRPADPTNPFPTDGECVPSTLPTAPPVTVTFGFNYLGDFSRVDPVCMNASTIAMTGFGITGTPLDAAIELAATGIIWVEVDRTVASRMNMLHNGSALPATADPRCNNWITPPPPPPSG